MRGWKVMIAYTVRTTELSNNRRLQCKGENDFAHGEVSYFVTAVISKLLSYLMRLLDCEPRYSKRTHILVAGSEVYSIE